MMFIKDQQDKPNCSYQAHVWFKNHSHQCACFMTKKAAELWAKVLHKRIVTADVLKELRNPARQ